MVPRSSDSFLSSAWFSFVVEPQLLSVGYGWDCLSVCLPAVVYLSPRRVAGHFSWPLSCTSAGNVVGRATLCLPCIVSEAAGLTGWVAVGWNDEWHTAAHEEEGVL